MNRDPEIDIVIASYGVPGDTPPHLQLCLDTIARYTPVPHRVILERSTGSAAANRNRGLARCAAPFVCLLDDDAWVTPGWCQALLVPLADHSTIGMAGPKIKQENGRIFCAGIDYRPEVGLVPRGQNHVDDGALDETAEPWAIPSTCLLIRREAVARAGGFDEQYRSSQWEDIDYYLRLRAAGFRGVVVGKATVYHRNLYRTWHYEANQARFLARWGSGLGMSGE